MMRTLLISILCCLCQLASAQPVYKCSSGGKLSYGDRPCADGSGTRLPPPARGVDLPEANTAATRDARTLLQLEKLRIARDKDEVLASRAQQKVTRAAAARRKTCDRLRLRHKWAQDDLASLHRAAHTPDTARALEKARTKARQQAETLALECPV